MSHLLAETEPVSIGDGRWTTHTSADWNIDDTPNGGYALIPVIRALGTLGPHSDPLSVTTGFLRPVTGGAEATITGEVVRAGRTTTVVRGTLGQEGRERLTVLATLGDLAQRVGIGPELQLPPPGLPDPDLCVSRERLDQGVELPVLRRLDVRIDPALAVGGTAGEAVIAGWIRLRDGTDPTGLALVLFADAFPPSLYPLVGRVGWVPTIELTVHVRRRPAPGWVQARFECDDLHDGTMIESGTLWDSTGRVVARSRQLGLLLPRDD